MKKSELRTMFLKRRKQLDSRMHAMFNMMLLDRLEDYLENIEAKHVAIFYPMHNEVDLRALKHKYTVYLPKIKKGKIVFYADRGAYKDAPFGTTVPAHDDDVNLNDIDVVIVPGLVYDLGRYRIGYGKGYYDKLLAEYNQAKVGVCFDLFVVNDLPIEAHDERVDVLITDQRTIKG